MISVVLELFALGYNGRRSGSTGDGDAGAQNAKGVGSRQQADGIRLPDAAYRIFANSNAE
jgi:hypothetical protein